ncbi:Mycolic acid cyclopropane synthase [Cynara cardunculus var. scolymus]|uniref:Mycolic acid cyclopropane synthase n=1 Tax=Cynara cardunculus var. scolymus TaxID=59895 RepID=A0A124SCD8_CYNCS|nr:Mycolic acid cyclopropane synthase [Cynara cardunculus var. scolymus]
MGQPVPTIASSKALAELNHIKGKRRIWFCGSYQGYGFHKDKLKAGMVVPNGMINQSYEFLNNPKQMVPSLMEAGARSFVVRFLRDYIAIGTLILLEDGGETFTFEGTIQKGPLKIVTEADIGLADAYINGDFSFVDKTKGLLYMIMAQVDKNHEVLEIGSGWGTLAIEIVKQTGCKYTGITPSKEQLKYAERKVKECGLQDQIKFQLCDYWQLPDTLKFDRIISCEMIEHVGHEYYEDFFRCCESLLVEDGIFVLHFISVPDGWYDESRRTPNFIKEYIFLGGCLPSLNRGTSAMAASSRLSVDHVEKIGTHYYQTLRLWRTNFMKNKSWYLFISHLAKSFPWASTKNSSSHGNTTLIMLLLDLRVRQLGTIRLCSRGLEMFPHYNLEIHTWVLFELGEHVSLLSNIEFYLPYRT